MIITITLIISVLVAINFLLLIFSCNKYPKKALEKSPKQQTSKSIRHTNLSEEKHQKVTTLAATGS
jgi:hypothetical protein